MFIDITPEGVLAASAASAALSAETLGHVGQAAAAGAVVPPGLDPDISPLNVAKITAYAAAVAGVLAASGGLQELYAVANGASATVANLNDAFSAVGINAII
ncbi:MULTISPECIES: hypothetical protein [Mycolicibacterium]|jgi:hypothetical protein|uniref:PE domain-containing protein n=1 Tax=Mycolicibacterium fallax TaxID=1793 RepID=A0A1X1RK28_MYCFA|nr:MULTISPECIES: hypothetical protein [Mycolicibacterium]MCV7041935.1 hypothetical protein [Mycolicibacterium moriokaense]ORV08024.1 hypothetical protein AWC04_02420 [Mycolicibacterium fallax]